MFETSIVPETALRMVDEAILRQFRRMWGRRVAFKNNPSWHHRKVVYTHLGNGEYAVSIKGRFMDVDRPHLFTAELTASVLKRRGTVFPGQVTGFIEDHVRYFISETIKK